jgi:serine/threonine-protein kinase
VLSPGIVLNGRYQLTQRIAAGGMGEVWRGSDLLLHREVAVKVLLPALMADQEFITRFRTEARMMAALRHPGIVQVYDYGENATAGDDRFDFLVMEYIEGTPLTKRIQQTGRLGVAETMTIVAQVAEALQAAHEAGIIHRDVKPSNLLVRPAGAIVLVDFGVARSAGITSITSTNVVMGSAHYMAPEQAEGKPVSAATDVYALGAVAFSCLAGRPPYVGDNPLAVLAQLIHGQPPVLPGDIPAAAGAVVLRALAREPGQRFPSAAALAEAARAVAAQPGGAVARAYGSATPGQTYGSATPGQTYGSGTPGQTFGSAAPVQPSAPAYGAAAPGQPGYRAAAPVPGAAASGAVQAPAVPAPGADRRRKKLLAVVAGAVVLASGGTGVVLASQSGSGGQAQIQQPPAQGEDVAAKEEVAVTEPTKSKGGKPAKPNGPAPASSPAGTGDSPAQPGTTSAPTDPATTPATPGPGTTTTPSGTPTTAPATTTPAAPEPTQPYTATQVCGSGYTVIDSAPLKASGVVKGRVHLLYQASSGKNCVVTLKTVSVGKKTATTAYLEVKGKSRVTDSGSFAYYAGPVSATAKATCVKWGGSVGTATYASPFEHCD